MTTATRETRVRSSLIDRVLRVDLRVQDIDKALAFYEAVAGLETADRDGKSASLRSPGGPIILRLDSTGITEPADPHAAGLFHTAFRFPTRSALGDVLVRVVDSGIELGAGDHIVSEALYVDDPDGNGVELYWDRPGEQWPAPTAESLVPMATLPVDLEDLYEKGRGEAALGDKAPPGTDIGHVHLQVSDVSETISFYADILGLDLTARMGGQAGFLSSKGYHHHIGANSWRSAGADVAASHRAGLRRVVFGVTDDHELKRLAQRLRKVGWKAEVTDTTIAVLDPDGIELRFALS